MKTKVAFMCWWGRSPTWLLEYYSRYSRTGTPHWNNIEGTDRVEDADVVFILESLPPGLPENFKALLATKKLYLVRHEPPDIAAISNVPIGLQYLPPELRTDTVYVDYTLHDIWYPSKWDIGEVLSYQDFQDLEYSPKSKKVSCIVSDKIMVPGHMDRLNFVDNFIQDSIHQLELYGRNKLAGCIHHGEVSTADKPKAFVDYEYSLSFENCQIPNYVTCKVFEPLLMWSMPIYWGSNDIEKYLPADSYYSIPDLGYDRIKEIDEVMKRPPDEKNIKAMKEARELILDKYNIWATVENIMERF